MRKISFQTGSYYHVFNHGVDKRDIFLDDWDFIRFIVSMREFNRENPIGSLYIKNKTKENNNKVLRVSERLLEPLVDIVCYSLLPNHYHLLLKQKIDKGISKFMLKMGMGYANYYNCKYDRSGSLFRGTYKAKYINTDSYLLKLSCYINGNSEIHKICKAEDWTWNSYRDYLDLRNGTLCDKNVILKDFENIQEYKDLTDYVIKNSGELKEYILE